MYVVNIKIPEKSAFIWSHNNQIVSLTSVEQKIKKIRSKTVNIIFGSHHMTRTIVCFTLMFRIGSFPEARICLL